MGGLYMATSGPIGGSVSGQNIFSVENPVSSTENIRVVRASVHGVVTGLFSSAFGYSVSRTTATPTGGSAISPFKRLSSDPAPIAVFRASPTATAAAGPAKTRSPGVLLGLSVTGSFVCPPLDLLLALREVDAVVLAPGDGLLIHAAANSAGWTHFADFEVVSG